VTDKPITPEALALEIFGAAHEPLPYWAIPGVVAAIEADRARARIEGARMALEAAAKLIAENTYFTAGDRRGLEPARFPGHDQHHATLADAIRALDPAAIAKGVA
jgi:hypothetical protein